MQKPDLKKFVPKTPAKAEEVNYNFEQMDDYVGGTADELKALVNSAISNMNLQLSQFIVTGMLLPYDGDVENIPNGWLLCDGRAVSRETYKNLYNKIGTKHGAGNGVTTFNLPNYIGRFIEGGTEAGIVKQSALPAHHHYIARNQQSDALYPTLGNNYLCFANSGLSNGYVAYALTGTGNAANIGLTSNAISNINNNSGKVQPPSVTALVLIKT